MGKAKYEVGDIVHTIVGELVEIEGLEISSYSRPCYFIRFMDGPRAGNISYMWPEELLEADPFDLMTRRLQREERSRKSKKSRAARR